MKLTRRESILIAVLILLLLGIGVYYFVFIPVSGLKSEQDRKYEQLELQQITMQQALSRDMSEAYQGLMEQARDNYDAFYVTLNSYTIDKILNGLVDEYALHIYKMKISPYLPVEPETLPQPPGDGSKEKDEEDDGEEEESLLLKCTVDLEAGGDFTKVMGFLDALNEKSFCVSVQNLRLEYRTETNLIQEETRFSCAVEIYGVALPGDIPLDE